MPTYDFRCKHCGHRFEITRPITDDGTPDCPTCGEASNVVKVFPRVGISFKGSGFYKTDSRGSAKSRSESGSSGDSSTSGGSSSGSGSGDSSSGSGSSAAPAAPASGSSSTASTAKVS